MEGKLLLETSVNSNLIISQSLLQFLVEKLLKSSNVEESFSIYNLLNLIISRNPRSTYPSSCDLIYLTKEKNKDLNYKMFNKLIFFLNKSEPLDDLLQIVFENSTPFKRKRKTDTSITEEVTKKKKKKII